MIFFITPLRGVYVLPKITNAVLLQKWYTEMGSFQNIITAHAFIANRIVNTYNAMQKILIVVHGH